MTQQHILQILEGQASAWAGAERASGRSGSALKRLDRKDGGTDGFLRKNTLERGNPFTAAVVAHGKQAVTSFLAGAAEVKGNAAWGIVPSQAATGSVPKDSPDPPQVPGPELPGSTGSQNLAAIRPGAPYSQPRLRAPHGLPG